MASTNLADRSTRACIQAATCCFHLREFGRWRFDRRHGVVPAPAPATLGVAIDCTDLLTPSWARPESRVRADFALSRWARRKAQRIQPLCRVRTGQPTSRRPGQSYVGCNSSDSRFLHPLVQREADQNLPWLSQPHRIPRESWTYGINQSKFLSAPPTIAFNYAIHPPAGVVVEQKVADASLEPSFEGQRQWGRR